MTQQLNREFLGNKYGRDELKRSTEIYLTSSGINKIKPNAFKIRKHIFDFKGLNVKVETLNLDSNEISEIESKTFHYLPNLKHLNLSNNKLKHFDSNIFKEDLVNLETLHLNNNELEKISFKNLSNLRELYLNGNKLISIDSSTFSGLGNLIILDLGNNKIESIDKFSFESLSKLKVLKLNNNYLKRIDPKCFERLKSIEVIQLYDNKLNVRSFFNESTNLIDINRLNQHGFLSDWKKFSDQYIFKLSTEIYSIEEPFIEVPLTQTIDTDLGAPKKPQIEEETIEQDSIRRLPNNISQNVDSEISERDRIERLRIEQLRREREIDEEQRRNIEERQRF